MLLLLVVLFLLVPGAGGEAAPDVRSVGAQTAFDPANALDIALYCNGQDQLNDLSCVAAWFNAALAAGKHMYASAGTYLFSKEYALPTGTNVHIKCENPMTTIFKRMSTSLSGHLFVLSPTFQGENPPWDNFSIENCGFDANGWDMAGESTVFFGLIETVQLSHLTLRGNRFFDSAQPGGWCSAYPNCQRQYIVTTEGTDMLIEDNILTEGGRIKAGRPGHRIWIRNNRIHQVNDNGITVVQLRTQPSSDILIEDNVISDAIHSYGFFGADGEKIAESPMLLQDVTWRNNTFSGGFLENGCLTGVLGNHTKRLYIANNICHKTNILDPGNFPSGILMKRAGTGFRFTQWITLEQNAISSDVPNVFNSGGAIGGAAQHDRFCILGNTVRNNTNAIYLQAAMPRVLALGNDLGPGGLINQKTPASIHLTMAGSTSHCYRDRRHILPMVRVGP